MKKELNIPYEIIPHEALSPVRLEMERLAIEAARKAYAPYSRFHVGAAVLLENGQIITGSNQENAAYPSGTCAERTALFYAGAQYPDVAPQELMIVAFNQEGRVPLITPCGSCRQVIIETATRFAPYKILLAGQSEVLVLEDCRSLLPFAFDGSDL
ncbi:cytidine deaminase [Porphyromonas sp. COT-290 OH3588]|uniref:cytidine deaminase n=1 Tax=Porphyromonas sp. COT-290 OH3588 TaxID=1515617 RepID=UPI00052E3766|nr:cytidine deaminase [Porphyromonas sp. COT-290 OH3588]KGO00989.1 cytidine deaminase [Porphyromonas sp. COT-290 OH3588]